MRHIDHEDGADRIGHPANAGEVDHARIGGAAGDDQLRLFGVRHRLQLVVIQQPVFDPDAILDGAEPFAGHVGAGAVGEVAAGVERHAQDGVARFDGGEEDGLVGLGTGMRLHIGEAAAEQLLGALNGQGFHHVHLHAAAVIAAAGIALGIFVGKDRALRFQHRGGDDVLAGDQFDAVLLADQFAPEGGGQIRVRLRQGGGKEALGGSGESLIVHARSFAEGRSLARRWSCRPPS